MQRIASMLQGRLSRVAGSSYIGLGQHQQPTPACWCIWMPQCSVETWAVGRKVLKTPHPQTTRRSRVACCTAIATPSMVPAGMRTCVACVRACVHVYPSTSGCRPVISSMEGSREGYMDGPLELYVCMCTSMPVHMPINPSGRKALHEIHV